MLQGRKLVAFDVETTGIAKTSRIVELAAIRFDLHGVNEEFQTLIDPEIQIPWQAQRVHNISNAMVASSPKARDALINWLRFISEDDILIAHYAEYDVGIMTYEFFRCGLTVPHNIVIDSCRLARRFLDFPNYKLDTLRDELGPRGSQRHRAHGDCLAVIEIVRASLADKPELTISELQAAGMSIKGFDFLKGIDEFVPRRNIGLVKAYRNQEPIRISTLGGNVALSDASVVPQAFYWYEDELYLEVISMGENVSLAMKVAEVEIIS